MYFLLSFLLSVRFVSALPSLASVTAALASPTANGTMTCVFNAGQQVGNCTVSANMTTTAPASTASAAAAFVMPGTSLQVFPIGLGIYGGITAVAVVVVVLMTVERIRDRKRFRRQRMLESGSFGVTKN